jgi:hypothetical protein
MGWDYEQLAINVLGYLNSPRLEIAPPTNLDPVKDFVGTALRNPDAPGVDVLVEAILAAGVPKDKVSVHLRVYDRVLSGKEDSLFVPVMRQAFLNILEDNKIRGLYAKADEETQETH